MPNGVSHEITESVKVHENALFLGMGHSLLPRPYPFGTYGASTLLLWRGLDAFGDLVSAPQWLSPHSKNPGYVPVNMHTKFGEVWPGSCRDHDPWSHDCVSSCGFSLMPVVYQVVGFGRGVGRHSACRRRSLA